MYLPIFWLKLYNIYYSVYLKCVNCVLHMPPCSYKYYYFRFICLVIVHHTNPLIFQYCFYQPSGRVFCKLCVRGSSWWEHASLPCILDASSPAVSEAGDSSAGTPGSDALRWQTLLDLTCCHEDNPLGS